MGGWSLAPGRPVWIRCSQCEEFICRLHGRHASSCPCPSLEFWRFDPYGPLSQEDADRMQLGTAWDFD